MGVIQDAKDYYQLLNRISKEFLNDRLGLKPSTKELAEFTLKISEFIHDHKQKNMRNNFQG